MNTPAFLISKLHYSLPHQPIFNGFDLSIPTGQIFCLLGENGVGKSTLLRLMLNLTPPKTGAISINGIDSHLPRSRQPIAFLPDRYSPPYFLSGKSYLDYGLKLYQANPSPALRSQLLQQFELTETVLNKKVRDYSKGMVQKLCLAVCFLSQKSIIVLDEPLSGLDPSARVQVKRYMRRLKEMGTTIIFTSHLLADVEEVADITAILHSGELRYAGPTKDCLTHFNSPTLEAAYLKAIDFETEALG